MDLAHSDDGDTSNFSPGFFLGLLLLAYFCFIAFVSFYLPDFISPYRLARAGADKLFFLADEFQLRWWNLPDIAINLLLYMPLGFLVAVFLATKLKLNSPGIFPWLGFFLSVGVEVIQAFIGRFSDATDVLSNGSGYLLGFLIARAALVRYRINPADLVGLSTLIRLRFLYLVVVILTALLPLDISFSIVQISGKLQAHGSALPRLIVDPFYHFSNTAEFQYLISNLLMFLPLALLSSIVQMRRAQASVLISAVHCLLLGITVEGANLFIQSGRSDIAVPIMGFATAMMMAWLVGIMAGQRPQHAGSKVNL